ncbi:MAG: hypothetical protein P4L53_14005 [Candidatus Obscuribacterales bacterium]|nr:hypothetical protein [Candidatus Obscuribacterales bacterium]
MLIALLAVTMFWLFALWFGARFIAKRLGRRRKVIIAELHNRRLRLHAVISELMAKANELDQHRQYVVLPANDQTSHRLAAVCQDLVVLSESLTMIENLLKEGNIKHGRRDILIAVNSAVHLNRHLDGVSQQLRIATEAQSLSLESQANRDLFKRESTSDS